ncbi:MAG: altronate dehydratase family protein [Chitinophagaceae bacterium]
MSKIIKIHERDNVITALTTLQKEEQVRWGADSFDIKEEIPAKHKFFAKDFNTGDEVYMYGVLVGKALMPVAKGSRMTTENVKHAAEKYAFRNVKNDWTPPDISQFINRTFRGYKRDDGKAGTANYWLFIPTVFCENRNMDVIKEALQQELGYAVNAKYKSFTKHLVTAFKEGADTRDFNTTLSSAPAQERLFKNVDGVKFLNHNGGCGGTRQDADTLSKLLSAYANHPNVGGVTILSLGCQHLQTKQLLDDIKKGNPNFNKPLLVFEQQQIKSEEELIALAIRETFNGLVELNKIEREEISISKLVIGVKCGGSDGFSGISANPAVGYAADLLVALGGTVLLAEFPELCGVEQNIIDRCTSEETAKKFIDLMQTYDAQAHAVGSGFYMNPSPGNIKDGLITDAIKSAGAAKKGGTSPVTDVLDYTEPATKPGLNLVCTPGNDVEATTGKAAAGATLILFTTGLGTPTGNPICLTIKVATNSTLANKMQDIIDIDCGPIIRGEKTIQQMGEDILEYCIKAASGEIIPKAVQLNQDDFIPWKRGVSL